MISDKNIWAPFFMFITRSARSKEHLGSFPPSTSDMLALFSLFVLVTSCVTSLPQQLPPEIGERHHSNPETAAGLFEGDIELNGFNPFDRNAIRDPRKRWPNGVVPYIISHQYDAGTRETIENAMKEIEHDTRVNGKACITFIPRSNEHDYTELVKGHGCHSPIGREGGHQTCTLSDGCYRKGTIMHELLHTLGFMHEQTEPERDKYVTINFNNIEKGHEHNFEKHTTHEMDTLGMPYDYNSIMHYNAYEFAIDDNKPTIIPKQSGVYIGQRIKLSTLDIKKIQILYGCLPRDSSYTPPTVGTPAVYKDACTFQSNMCDWSNLGSDDMNWERRKGRTPSGRTGPNYDHSLSYEGYFLYMEASHHTHDTALIGSKRYSAGKYCITFFYHMYGGEEGTLTLRADTSGHHTTLATIKGNKGDIWHSMEVPYTSAHHFQFQFAGSIGSGSKSDIALDDISVHTGDCPGNGGIVG